MAKELIAVPNQSSGDLQCQLQFITSITGFDSEKASWIDFLNRPTVRSGLFTDPRTIAQDIRFDRGDELVLCKVYVCERLVSVVPLVLRKTHARLMFGLVTIGRLFVRSARIADFEFPTEQGICPYRVFATVLDACSKQKPKIDLVSVDSAPMHKAELASAGLRMVNVQATYTIEFTGRFDAYLQLLSPRSRQTIKRKLRRFESTAEAPVRVVSFRNPADMDQLHLALTRVWDKSWHARLGNQQLSSVAALSALATVGWVRAYVLYVGDQSVASVLGFQYRDTYYYESPAYDQDWQERSPGIVLLYHIVQDLFDNDRPVRLDFGAGFGQYKQVFGTHEESRGSIQVGITGRGKLVTRLQSCLRVLFKSSRVALQWTGIPRSIKRRVWEGK